MLQHKSGDLNAGPKQQPIVSAAKNNLAWPVYVEVCRQQEYPMHFLKYTPSYTNFAYLKLFKRKQQRE
jgi:hypothetical protein